VLSAQTAGNAIFLAYDGACVLATDPWMGEEDEAYFGSWTLPWKIPADIKQDINAARYIWFSHGHPDHLNPHSIHRLHGKKILLPDHVGGRICGGLRDHGFDVEILPDRRWVQLSARVRVFCITTVIQDAILLIDINGHLFVNMNDAWTLGCGMLIRRICKSYRNTYLLRLGGHSDADMIHLFDEAGDFITPFNGHRPPPGDVLYDLAKRLGINHIIPFSSFHTYQRADSVWAQRFTRALDDYRLGKISARGDVKYIAPFARIDCANGAVEQIEVAENPVEVRAPEEFGDCWSDELGAGDVKRIADYFRRKEAVSDFLSFINLRVGGKDNFVDLNGGKDRGITFEVPRGSLMRAIEHKIFDDLLIGNFMKTTLHNMPSLYAGDFNFHVTKYGDNGGAESAAQLDAYLSEYRRRTGLAEAIYERFNAAVDLATRFLPQSERSIYAAVNRRIVKLNREYLQKK